MSRMRQNPNIKVLMYHRVVKKNYRKTAGWHSVDEGTFRLHLRVLELLSYTPITFEDYQLYLNEEQSLPEKPIILTFDTGHLDTFEVAMPVLNEYGMRAVIFASGNRDLRYTFWDQEHDQDKSPLMNDKQILKVRENGYEVGAHSMTHPNLRNLSEEQLEEEIIGSKKSLEKILQEPVLSFAYPFGLVNERAIRVVQKAGFQFACSAHNGSSAFGSNPYNIRRLVISKNMGIVKFLVLMLFSYENLEWIYQKFLSPKSEKWRTSERVQIPRVDYENTFSNRFEPK